MRHAASVLQAFATALVLVTAILGPTTATAAELFVDAVNGSDLTGNGSSLSPFRTIARGMSVAVPGDNLRVQPGLYDAANGELFPIYMRQGVSVLGAGTDVVTVATENNPAFWWDYNSHGMPTRLEGLAIVGVGAYASGSTPALVIDASYGAGPLPELTTTIANNVIDGFNTGLSIHTGYSDGASVLDATIENNVFRFSQFYSVSARVEGGDHANLRLRNNLLELAPYTPYLEGGGERLLYGNNGLNSFFYAVGGNCCASGGTMSLEMDANAVVGGSVGAHVHADGGYLYGERVRSGAAAKRSAGFDAEHSGGQVEATVSNNIFVEHPASSQGGFLAHATGTPYGGGGLQLTLERNRIQTYYGAAVATHSYGSGTYELATVNATIINNDIQQPETSETLGFSAEADERSVVSVLLQDNHIAHDYGVWLSAHGHQSYYGGGGYLAPGADLLPAVRDGGQLSATLLNNTVASQSSWGYAVYAAAWEATTGTGLDGGGLVDLTIIGNHLTGGTALGIGSYAPLWSDVTSGGGGELTAQIERNRLDATRTDTGYGALYARADSAYPAGGGRTGGMVDLTALNNSVRGADGVVLRQWTASETDHHGKIAATLLNNTVAGGDNLAVLTDPSALILEGGTPVQPLQPTVANNIFLLAQPSGDPVVRTGGSSYATPSIFDSNLLHRAAGGTQLADFDAASQTTEAELNAFSFAQYNVVGDPEFVDATNGNFLISATSPALDVANPSYAPADDLPGFPRPMGLGPDIGAWERQDGPVMRTVRFQDVPLEHPFFADIDAIARAEITFGCSLTPPLYCPDAPVTREQMAVFMVRALSSTPDTSGPPRFVDVGLERPTYGYVQRFASLGITGGCGLGRFCPADPVTRWQMAVFLIKALGESPRTCGGAFSDVPTSNPYCGYIERLAELGVTSGCGGGRFCPDSMVTRGQMAVFLNRAFDLTSFRARGVPGIASGERLIEGAGVLHALAASDPGSEIGRPSTPVPAVSRQAVGPLGTIGPVENERLRLRPELRQAVAAAVAGQSMAAAGASPGRGLARPAREGRGELRQEIRSGAGEWTGPEQAALRKRLREARRWGPRVEPGCAPGAQHSGWLSRPESGSASSRARGRVSELQTVLTTTGDPGCDVR